MATSLKTAGLETQLATRRPPRRVKYLQEESQDNDDTDDFYILKIGSKSSRPITVELLVNAKELTMEVDTGACVSIISEATGKALFPGTRIKKSTMLLKNLHGREHPCPQGIASGHPVPWPA